MMIKHDLYGLPVTAQSNDAVMAINHFTQQLMRSSTATDQVFAAAEQHADGLMLQCYAATLHLYMQNDEQSQKAKSYLDRAKKLLKHGLDREKLYYHAIVAWSKCDYSKAIKHFIEITQSYPRDAVAAKYAEWMLYCSGQAFNAKQFFSMCHDMADKNQTNPYFLSTYAFAAELTKQYDLAEKIAEQSLALDKNAPWTHHALSHIYLYRQQFEQGITALESFKDSWMSILSTLRCHNSWHLALFYLANLDEKSTIDLYRSHLWDNQFDIILKQVDAISLLWRMEMAGFKQDNHWQDVVHYLGHYPYEHYVPFHNMFFIYALTRAGETTHAQQAIEQLEQYAATKDGEYYHVWHQVALPLLKGTHAFAAEDYTEAKKQLEPIIKDVLCVGGSDAQDEVMHQMYLVTLIKNAEQKAAQKFSQQYLSHYHGSALHRYWFSV